MDYLDDLCSEEKKLMKELRKLEKKIMSLRLDIATEICPFNVGDIIVKAKRKAKVIEIVPTGSLRRGYALRVQELSGSCIVREYPVLVSFLDG